MHLLSALVCPGCRQREHKDVYTHGLYPDVVLKFEVRVAQETVIMGTEVDPAAGANPVRWDKKKAKAIIFRTRSNVCSMERVSGTYTVWGSLLRE